MTRSVVATSKAVGAAKARVVALHRAIITRASSVVVMPPTTTSASATLNMAIKLGIAIASPRVRPTLSKLKKTWRTRC